MSTTTTPAPLPDPDAVPPQTRVWGGAPVALGLAGLILVGLGVRSYAAAGILVLLLVAFASVQILYREEGKAALLGTEQRLDDARLSAILAGISTAAVLVAWSFSRSNNGGSDAGGGGVWPGGSVAAVVGLFIGYSLYDSATMRLAGIDDASRKVKELVFAQPGAQSCPEYTIDALTSDPDWATFVAAKDKDDDLQRRIWSRFVDKFYPTKCMAASCQSVCTLTLHHALQYMTNK